MRSAERVVDVRVVAVDEPRDERGIVALLPRVEPQVLEQLDAGRELRESSAAPAPSSTGRQACPSAARGGCRS